MNKNRMLMFLLAACVCAASAGVWADEAAEKGRAVYASQKDSVITVRAVISMSRGEQERENSAWANGTVLDPSGLTVLSLTLIDPTSLYRSMGAPDEGMSSKIVSLHILTPGGGEIPAEVVLRDEELDLAFVRPVTPPDSPMACVNLDAVGHPELLDTVAVIGQLGEVAQRAHCVLLSRIESIVEKPRRYYVPGDDRARAIMSAPAFTLDGEFVGMGAWRAIKNDAAQGDNVLVVLIPAEDIKEGMAQVPGRQ